MVIKDAQDFITLCKRKRMLAPVILLIALAFVFAQGYFERKGQNLADGPSEEHTEDNPSDIPKKYKGDVFLIYFQPPLDNNKSPKSTVENNKKTQPAVIVSFADSTKGAVDLTIHTRIIPKYIV